MDSSIGKLSDFDEEVSKSTTTELKQFNEYRKYVDCFGDETLERIHVLEKFAPHNCYAADELGNVYYFGAPAALYRKGLQKSGRVLPHGDQELKPAPAIIMLVAWSDAG